MFVKLLTRSGDHAAGAILDVSSKTAEHYVKHGAAVLCDDEAAGRLEREVKAEMQRGTAELKDNLKEVMRSVMSGATSNGPPSKGIRFDENGVPFNRIEGQSAPEDRNARGEEKTSFGEVLQLVARARSFDVDVSERSWAEARLKRHYVHVATDDLSTATERSFAVSRANTESMTGGAGGGFLVRPEFANSLFELAMEDQVVEPFATQVPVGMSDAFEWPALDQYGPPVAGNSAMFGGVQVYRKGEIDARTPSEFKLRNIQFKISDLTGYTELSRDLLMDNIVGADMIAQRNFGKAIAWKKDWEFLNADGIGKPTGILKSPATLTINRTSANHIVFEDLAGMTSQFFMAGYGSAMFIGNQTIIKDLMAIKDGAGNRVYLPAGGVAQDTPPSVLDRTTRTGLRYAAQGVLHGLPIRFTEKLPALGTTGDLMLIDPTQYGVATRMGLEVGISQDFKFQQDLVSFRFKIRNDAQSLWLAPYTSADSAGTKFSPFIKLS